MKTRLPDGSPIALRQETEYPWEGRVSIRVEAAPERPIRIRLRIPAWAKGARLVLGSSGGDEEVAVRAGDYASVERCFRAGDELRLDLAMEARLVIANPLVEETRNQAALCRGPIVYCLESKDLPEGVRVEDIALPSGARFEPEPGEGALKGMRVLAGSGLRLVAELPASELYSDLPAHRLEALRLRFIPYYAWDNRGLSEMSVWLPLRWD